MEPEKFIFSFEYFEEPGQGSKGPAGGPGLTSQRTIPTDPLRSQRKQGVVVAEDIAEATKKAQDTVKQDIISVSKIDCLFIP